MPKSGSRRPPMPDTSSISLDKLIDIQRGFERLERREDAREIGEIIREVQKRVTVPRASLTPEQLSLIDSVETEATRT